MRRTSVLLAVGILTLGAPASRAVAQTSPLHSGSWLIGGSAGLTRDRNSQQGATTTHVALDPTGLVFVDSHLALGAAFLFGYDELGNGHALAYGIGPAARYYPMTGAPWLPFLALSATPEWQSVTGDGFPNTHSSLLAIDGSLGLTRMLATHVGLDGAFFYRHSKLTNRVTPTRISWTQDDYGLRFGLSVFVH